MSSNVLHEECRKDSHDGMLENAKWFYGIQRFSSLEREQSMSICHLEVKRMKCVCDKNVIHSVLLESQSEYNCSDFNASVHARRLYLFVSKLHQIYAVALRPSHLLHNPSRRRKWMYRDPRRISSPSCNACAICCCCPWSRTLIVAPSLSRWTGLSFSLNLSAVQMRNSSCFSKFLYTTPSLPLASLSLFLRYRRQSRDLERESPIGPGRPRLSRYNWSRGRVTRFARARNKDGTRLRGESSEILR